MSLATEYASAASGTSWTNPTNANADDAAYATYVIAAKNTTGNVNTLSNFGFDSSIPSGSTINSVTLEVEHKVSTTGGIAFLESALAISGTPGTYNSDSAEPTTDTQRIYSAMARPGGGSWTRADLLDGTFTVLLRARSGNSATSVTYSWDYARVVVDYTPGAQSLTQSSRFDNSNDLTYAHTVTPGEVALTQSARFDNGAGFYAHTVTPGEVALTQSARFDGTAGFYTHTVSQGGAEQNLTQSARFDNSAGFYAHTVTPGEVALTQSTRFDNSPGFYAHTLTPGEVALTQSARFDNSAGFYAHTVTPGEVALTQSASFDNSPGFYVHTMSLAGGDQFLTQSARFDNDNTFFPATVSHAAAPSARSGARWVAAPLRRHKTENDEALLITGLL